MFENATLPRHVPSAAGRPPVILVVEHDQGLRHVLRVALGARGYEVLEAATGTDGLWAAAQRPPDLVIAALNLPDIDGQDFTEQLRAWSRAPIVLLAAWGQEREVVAALDAGADDYVWQPFTAAQLAARVGGVLGRARARHGSVWQAGSLRIDLERERAWLNDHELQLSAIEYRLLAELARHAGTIVTPHRLLHAAWNANGEAQLQQLRLHLAQLRQRLETNPVWPRYLVAEPGVGYRLRIDADDDPRRDVRQGAG